MASGIEELTKIIGGHPPWEQGVYSEVERGFGIKCVRAGESGRRICTAS